MSSEPVTTRFPPEPNGYLHIGHLKAILRSFDHANQAGVNGQCILRFDDTNPDTEKLEYVQAIKRDIEWLASGKLGSHIKPVKITYTSDYFERLYQIALRLISLNLAYVDSAPAEQIKKYRYQGIATPDRERSIEENKRLFLEMRDGKHPEGSLVLRLKISVDNLNTPMRDPIAYRIRLPENSLHYRTGGDWSIYPSYDFSHGLVDSMEQITHSFCTREFFIRRNLYYWVIDTLNNHGGLSPDGPLLHRPVVEEFNRLNIEEVELSKRKILARIKSGEISGFDDPNLFTLAGLRARGYPADALIHFCNNYVEYSLADGGVIMRHKFDFAVREYLNDNTVRRFAVLDPLKLVIVNWQDHKDIGVIRPDVPDHRCVEGRDVPLNGVVWIDHKDFKLEPEKKYKRLAPGKEVRLRYYQVVKHIDHQIDLETGRVTEVKVELLTKKKCKGAAIHWVSDADKTVWHDCSSANGESPCFVENHVEEGQVLQFERLGYFKLLSEHRMRMITEIKSSYKEPEFEFFHAVN